MGLTSKMDKSCFLKFIKARLNLFNFEQVIEKSIFQVQGTHLGSGVDRALFHHLTDTQKKKKLQTDSVS